MHGEEVKQQQQRVDELERGGGLPTQPSDALTFGVSASPSTASASPPAAASSYPPRIPIKLDYDGAVSLLVLRDMTYPELLQEIRQTVGDEAAELAAQRGRLSYTDVSGDVLSIHNERTWLNAMLVLGYSDAEKLVKQGIKLKLTAEEPTAAGVAERIGAMQLHADASMAAPMQVQSSQPRLVHPKYKTEECKDFTSKSGCMRGARCSFKHTGVDDEIEIAELRKASVAARSGGAQMAGHGFGSASAGPARSLLYSRPCSFFHTPAGCHKGDACTFSHDPSMVHSPSAGRDRSESAASGSSYGAFSPSSASSSSHASAASASPSSRGFLRGGWSGGATSGFKSQGGRGRAGGRGARII